MATSAEIGLLGNTSSGSDLHRAEAVSVSAIAEAGLVVQGEVPGVLDTGSLMHEGLAVNRCAEAAQNEQAPGIAGLGRPGTKQGPSIVPEQHFQSVASAPRPNKATNLRISNQQQLA